MRNLGQRYVQYFNRRYERSGTLREGRYYSCLVDSAPYVIATFRYVERNPVRAGMTASAAEYRWSSHTGNAGQACNELLTPHAEYLALATNDSARHAAYHGLFATGDEAGFLAAIRDATNGGYALIGPGLRATLPDAVRRRMERRPPGPAPKPKDESRHPDAQKELELGLRPRTT